LINASVEYSTKVWTESNTSGDIKMRCVEDVENFPTKFDALPNFGNLEIEITVDDPKAYHKPWTVTVKQRILLNEENDRVHLHR